VEMRKDKTEREEHGVVEEGLGDHQDQRQDAPLSIVPDHRRQDQSDPKDLLGMDLDAFLRHWRMLPRSVCNVPFDLSDRPFRLLVLAMRNQPPRALGYEAAAPADIRCEQALIDQKRNGERPSGCAQPEAAVNNEVHPTAIFCWNEFV